MVQSLQHLIRRNIRIQYFPTGSFGRIDLQSGDINYVVESLN